MLNPVVRMLRFPFSHPWPMSKEKSSLGGNTMLSIAMVCSTYIPLVK